MTLEERYTASSKNTKNTKYSGTSKLDKDDTSKYNIDGNSTKYNPAGRLGDGSDTSKYNIDSTPTKYHG